MRLIERSPATTKTLVRGVNEPAGLEQIERRLFGRLSGGAETEALFGLAFAGTPRLDWNSPPGRVHSRRALCAISGRFRASSVLLTTHYLEEADAADRIVV